jgi:hypothetical protein
VGECLLHHPNQEGKAAIGWRTWLANEDGIVEEVVFASLWSLETWCGDKVCSVAIEKDESCVAHMDVYTVVGSDAIDGFYFRSMCVLVCQLVVSASTEYFAFEFGPFEGAACDGDDVALSACGFSDRVRLV